MPLELSRNRFDVRQSAWQLTIPKNYRQGHGRSLDPLLFDICRLCAVFTFRKKKPDLEFLTTVHKVIWYTYSTIREDATIRIHWRRRQQTLPKIWLVSNRLHGVTTQKLYLQLVAVRWDRALSLNKTVKGKYQVFLDAMKTYMCGGYRKLPTHFNLGATWKTVVSFTPRQHWPWVKIPGTYWAGGYLEYLDQTSS
jgi:hypothetical protein